MRVRKQSASGDYTFGGSQDAFYVNSPSGVGQLVGTGLRLWQGEWFLDTSAGVPWASQVLGKNGSSTYGAVLRAHILSTPGVSEIASYSSSFDNSTRKLSVTTSVASIYDPANPVTVAI